MIEPSFIDDLDFDIGCDFFDHIDDLLDFPNEDIDGGVLGGDCNGFQNICPAPQQDMLPSSDSGFTGNGTNKCSELPTELSVPQEDIAQLEWLSNFVEDSFSAGSITLDNENPNDQHYQNNNQYTVTTTATATNNINGNNKKSHQFRTSSPVSVLESSSSSSGGKSTLLGSDTVIPGRARSKRPRPAIFNPRPMLPLISPTSSVTDPTPQFSSELASELDNFAESHPINKMAKTVGSSEEKKKRKKKAPSMTDHSDSPHQPMAVRKCLHCEITKTPQWRAGPLGPKTLCNACGVRYKSGRLFPEYRPAASPTFVASLHSNSHKKVLEMRVNDDHKMGGTLSAMPPSPEFLPRSNYMIDYI